MDYQLNIYPHNDLLNLAWYHADTIRRKVDRNERDGLALDALSCIIAMAFSIEALINFVGFKRVPGWVERASFAKKIASLQGHMNLTVDWDVEPFRTLKELKELRDQIAHGKPIEKREMNADKGQLQNLMQTPWDRFLTPLYIENAYSEVLSFETQLLKAARIQAEQTLTQGYGTNVEQSERITIRSTHSTKQVRLSNAPKKPPKAIALDSAKIAEVWDQFAKASEGKKRYGPKPRTQFPRP